MHLFTTAVLECRLEGVRCTVWNIKFYCMLWGITALSQVESVKAFKQNIMPGRNGNTLGNLKKQKETFSFYLC